ncbi:MAG: YciI family protein [Candidatus Rokuibacteriota bacterium]
MSKYMLLLHDREELSELSPDEIQGIIEKHQAWMDGLREQGRFHGGDKLAAGGRTLVPSGAGVAVKDGPYSEGKEILGGYYLIEAASDDDAEAAARDLHAGGAHRTTIEVRQIEREPGAGGRSHSE